MAEAASAMDGIDERDWHPSKAVYFHHESAWFFFFIEHTLETRTRTTFIE